MANGEHVKLIKQGVGSWNDWIGNKRPNITADTSEPDLRRADLSGAKLIGANLMGTNFGLVKRIKIW